MSEIATAPIDIRSGPRGPQPRVSGKGVLVQAIATWLRMSPEEIAANYNLALGEVYAALSYCHDQSRGNGTSGA